MGDGGSRNGRGTLRSMHRVGLPDRSVLKWLYPGMHIKRWLVLLLLGVAIMGLGIAYLLREVYVTYSFPGRRGSAAPSADTARS